MSVKRHPKMEVWLSDLRDKARCRFPQNRCLCTDKIPAFPTIFGLQASAQTSQAVKSSCGNHRPIRTCGTVALNLRHNFLVPNICGGESPDLHFSLLRNWNSCVAYGDAVHSPKLWRSVNSLENILRQGLFLGQMNPSLLAHLTGTSS